MKDRNTFGSIDTIGMDVGDRTTEIVVVRRGVKVSSKRIKTTREDLEAFLATQPGCRVVIETGTHSPWMSDVISSKEGFELFVCNAAKLSRAGVESRKTDRLDAELLASLGSRDDLSIHRSRIHHRPRAIRADLSVLRMRSKLVESRTKLWNCLRATVKSFGSRLSSSSSASINGEALREQIPADLWPAASFTVNSIIELNKQIRDADRLIEKDLAARHPQVHYLAEIQGVGVLTAMAFLLVIGDAKRFTNSRAVAAYVGLAAKVNESGTLKKELGITKAGDVMMRRLLVQAAHYILAHEKADSDIRRFGQKLLERGGKAAKKRAVVAMARKLATVMYHLLATGEVYDPLFRSRRLDPQTVPA